MKKDSGFTLIELLVVLTIVSILTVTSIPLYQDYRARAFDQRALSDLRMVALAQEAFFLDTEKYLACTGSRCHKLPGVFSLSPGVSLAVTTNEVSFQGESSHKKGTGKVFVWQSDKGGLTTEAEAR
jgi:prepilin-type N-terminal cleavage/methylation domain-containing protein